jgi:heme-degrading monooxygenase HmoA
MAVKIIIKRIVPIDKVAVLAPLLRQLRALATDQRGYISGETLRNLDDPGEHLVISTWNSVEDWKKWEHNKERSEIQHKIDAILKQKIEYGIYVND